MTTPGTDRSGDPLDDDRTVAADDLPEDLDALLADLGDGEADDRTVAADPVRDTVGRDAAGAPAGGDAPTGGDAAGPAGADDLEDADDLGAADRTVPADDLPDDLVDRVHGGVDGDRVGNRGGGSAADRPATREPAGGDPWIRPASGPEAGSTVVPAPAPDVAAPGLPSTESAPPTPPAATPPVDDELGDDRTDHTVESDPDHPVVAPAARSHDASLDDERWRPPTRTGGALVSATTRSWPVWLVPSVAAVVIAAVVVLVVLL